MNKKAILVLEDDPYWHSVISSVLKGYDKNIVVDYAATIDIANRKLAGHNHYDLILVDQTLSGGASGYDFWKSLQATDFSGIPLVMVTGMKGEKFAKLFENETVSPLFFPKTSIISRLGQAMKWYLGTPEVQIAPRAVAPNELVTAETLLAAARAMTGESTQLALPVDLEITGVRRMPA